MMYLTGKNKQETFAHIFREFRHMVLSFLLQG